MALRVTQEDRQIIKDEFVFENQEHMQYLAILIQKYTNSKTLAEEKDLVEILDLPMERLIEISGDILFTLATTEPGGLPIQTVAGMIVNFLSPDDSIESRTKAMFCAMEILIEADRYVEVYESKNGHIMCETLISDEDIITRNIVKPLLRPTHQHKALGKFTWTLKESDALFKLNHIPMIILPIEDIQPHPATGTRYSAGFKKQDELCSKWKERQKLKKEFKDKAIFFNWAADYRIRMYPVGYYFNPQGTELEKNMLGFYYGELLNFQGLQDYKIAIASAYGLTKATDEDKLLWFIRNQNMLHIRRNTAKERHTFDALLYGWKQHLDGKRVTVPVEFD